MIFASEINISLSFSPVYLIIGVILSIIFSVWIYRITLPKISTPLKIFLTVLRSVAIALILLAIFEPVISIINKENINPKTFLFLDNSTSMKNYSETDSSEIIRSTNNLLDEITSETEIYSFGNVLRKWDRELLGKVKFDDSITNISSIIDEVINKKNEISSIVILSDGNYNSGSDPSNELNKLGIPIFTIGVGDTVSQKDIELRKVLYNKYLYAETESNIKAVLLNNGYGGGNVTVTLSEGNSLIERKTIVLSNSGIDYVDFTYKPITSGEKKLRVDISRLENESSFSNNSRSFFVNVIDNKLKIGIVSSSPSSDAKFIYNSLKLDEDLEIIRSIQISRIKFYDDFDNSKLNEADILFLIGFPGKDTPQNLLNLIKQKLSQNSPYLIIVNENTDLSRLRELSQFLPFEINQIRNDFTRVMLYVNDFNSPLLGNDLKEINLWNDLPPVLKNNSNFSAKPQSKVISKIKIGNTLIDEPLLITNNVEQKSIAILAGEIWKWKLNNKQEDNFLFDNFINTSLKWLRDESSRDKFIISSDKKIYSNVESIFLTAELYDEALNPVTNAEIEAELINSENEKIPFRFTYDSDGLYEYQIENLIADDYKITAYSYINNSPYKSAELNFSVENQNLELNSTLMNFEFLNNLSTVSNGKFYYLEDINNISTSVNNINNSFNRETINRTEFRFWSNEIVLIIVIILLAVEWFIRKRAGML